jgi:hypothetical protein
MARSSLPYALALAASLTLASCGGGSSKTTGPTDVPQEPVKVAAPAPPPSPEPPPRQFWMTASAGGQVYARSGCVRVQADEPPKETGCWGQTSILGNEGTRGTVTADPAPGYRFLRWSASSSDCPGESTNPCSFAFDRNYKWMTAVFGR